MKHHKVEKMGRLTKSKMLGIYKSRLHRYKKKDDFFGGVIHWQTRKTKKLTMAITKSMHAFLRLMLAEHYVFQMRKSYGNNISCQVTQGTLDDIYYGKTRDCRTKTTWSRDMLTDPRLGKDLLGLIPGISSFILLILISETSYS